VTSAGSETATIDLGSTRTERTAQRRVYIRDVARQLFDQRGFDSVTIAEVAAAASVAAQTVFNHFATKEELFFDGRTPRVDGPALAVQCRPSPMNPLAALRDHLVESVWQTVHWEATPEGRRYVAAIEASLALGAYERELVHQSQRGLRAALTSVGVDGTADSAAFPVEDSAMIAGLVSATWLAGVRELVVAHRTLDGLPDELASRAAVLAAQLLHHLSNVSGWPAVPC
jgi:AcrR family transcriptional regulator